MIKIPIRQVIEYPKTVSIYYTTSLICLFVYFIIFLVNACHSIIFPYPLEYTEGTSLNHAQLLSQGKSIYNDISNYPFIIGNYTPIYYLISAFFVKFSEGSLAVGRLISIISSISIGFLIFIIVKEKTTKKIALFSSLLYFSSPYTYHWTVLFRPDTLALLFSVCGVYCVLILKNNKEFYLSILFFILSIFTKQTFISAPIASFVYLFIVNRKLAIKLFATLIIVTIILFLFVNALTDGQFFLHTVKLNVNEFSLTRMITYHKKLLSSHGIIILLSLCYVVFKLIKKEIDLLPIYFSVSVIANITVGKIGSNTNYFLETITMACIMSSVLFFKVQHSKKVNSIIKFLLALLIVFQIIIFYHRPETQLTRNLELNKEISEIIRSSPGDILSEDPGILTVNGKKLLFQPFIFTQLYKQGVWDQTRLVNDIMNRKFSLIFLYFDVNQNTIYEPHRDRFTSEMIRAIREHYYLERKIIRNNNFSFLEANRENYIYFPK